MESNDDKVWYKNKPYYKGLAMARGVIDETPTADVVPRAEVERLEQILNSYALQYGTVKDQQEVIDKIKRETAMEMFEEIEKCWKYNFDGITEYEISKEDFDEFKKKYTGGE